MVVNRGSKGAVPVGQLKMQTAVSAQFGCISAQGGTGWLAAAASPTVQTWHSVAWISKDVLQDLSLEPPPVNAYVG